jgi:transcriptional regulator with XRE-family HTH domain
MSEPSSLGSRIRKYRKSRHLSLTRLADRCNISHSFLSQIERDQANPSIPTLYAIAETLGVSVADLFSDSVTNLAGAQLTLGESKTAKIIRTDQRIVIIYPDRGIRTEFLTPNLQGAIQMLWIVMPPGSDSGEWPFVHQGEECGVILQGQLETTIGGQTYRLGPGDSIYHDSTLPHQSRNVGDIDVIMVVAKTPFAQSI